MSESRSGLRATVGYGMAVLALPLVLFSLRRRLMPVEAGLDSMRPEIEPGDRIRVLTSSAGDDPFRRGDIVLFESWHEGETWALKRVIALPNETIEIHDEEVLIDGKRLDEPYLATPTHGVVAAVGLGAGEYFLMGDNRAQSCDSRVHGAVHVDKIAGRALLRYSPWLRAGFFEHAFSAAEGGRG